MRDCQAIEDAIADSLQRAGKYVGRGIGSGSRFIRRGAMPVAGGIATVGIASGGLLWHENRRNEQKYGKR